MLLINVESQSVLDLKSFKTPNDFWINVDVSINVKHIRNTTGRLNLSCGEQVRITYVYIGYANNRGQIMNNDVIR